MFDFLANLFKKKSKKVVLNAPHIENTNTNVPTEVFSQDVAHYYTTSIIKSALELKREETFIPFKELKIDYSAILGNGSYGRIYKATLNGVTVAVKLLNLQSESLDACEAERDILDLLRRKRAPYILPFYGQTLFPSTDSKYYCIVTAYAKMGSVRSHIEKCKSEDIKPFSDDVKNTILFQVSFALQFLHRNNIVHRDIKSDNVLLDHNFKVMLGDFGLSKVLDNQAEITGSPAYIAPEILEMSPASFEADMYSFGVFTWEMATYNRPFHHLSIETIFNKVRCGEREKIPFDAPVKLYNAITTCWQQNPADRPSAEDMVKVFSTPMHAMK